MSTLAIVAVVLVFGSYIWLVAANKEKNKNSSQSNYFDLLTLLFVVLESLGNLNRTWLPLLTLFIGMVLFVISFVTEPHKEQTPASTTPPAASKSAPAADTKAAPAGTTEK